MKGLEYNLGITQVFPKCFVRERSNNKLLLGSYKR